MAFDDFINTLPRHIAIDYHILKSLSPKIQNALFNIGFIQHVLFHELIPTFAKIKKQWYIYHKDRQRAVKSILNSYLLEKMLKSSLTVI